MSEFELDYDLDDFDEEYEDLEEEDEDILAEEFEENEEDEGKYKPDQFVDDLIEGVKIRKKENRITNNLLTKYEKTRVLAFRSLQISLGGEPKIRTQSTDPLEIAKLELKNKLLSLKILRYLNKNEAEEWDVNELKDFEE